MKNVYLSVVSGLLFLALFPPYLLAADPIASQNLARAAAVGDIKGIRTAIKKGADINFKVKGDMTPLMIASFGGYLEIVSVLLEAGADTGIRGPLGGQAIHFAASQCHDKVVARLLEAKAKLDKTDKGLTPLMMGMSENCIETLKVLLKAGDPVNAAQPDGWTPLMHAAAVGSPKVVSLLLDSGADPELMNSDGDTAEKVAEKVGKEEVVKLLKEKAKS